MSSIRSRSGMTVPISLVRLVSSSAHRASGRRVGGLRVMTRAVDDGPGRMAMDCRVCRCQRVIAAGSVPACRAPIAGSTLHQDGADGDWPWRLADPGGAGPRSGQRFRPRSSIHSQALSACAAQRDRFEGEGAVQGMAPPLAGARVIDILKDMGSERITALSMIFARSFAQLESFRAGQLLAQIGIEKHEGRQLAISGVFSNPRLCPTACHAAR